MDDLEPSTTRRVALRKESVDRNQAVGQFVQGFQASLSARRAWIEIAGLPLTAAATLVALRKESVDRNLVRVAHLPGRRASLSARRAWIEIHCCFTPLSWIPGRSPQGERG